MYYVYRRERLDPAELEEKFSPVVAKDLADKEKYALAGDHGLELVEGSLEALARKFVEGLNVPPKRVPLIELWEEGVVLRPVEAPLADILTYQLPGPISIRKKAVPLSAGGGYESHISAHRNSPLDTDEIRAFEQSLVGALKDFRRR